MQNQSQIIGQVTEVLPDWWKNNARKVLEYLLNNSGAEKEFKELVSSVLIRGRFLRSSLALQMPNWLSVKTNELPLIQLLGQVELIHAAACALDDVIDGDTYRRGIPTFQTRSGLPAAILTPMHMVSRALMNEKIILKNANGPLFKAFDQMVIGASYDTIQGFGNEEDPEKRLKFALDKTKPLFGCAFWYTGKIIKPEDVSFAENCKSFGEKLGLFYQTANDFHDVFSIGPLVRGKADDKTTITYSMPYRYAVEKGIANIEDIGKQVTRNELQEIYNMWTAAGVTELAKNNLYKIKDSCLENFPGVAPEELKNTLDLISSKIFWEYKYQA